MGFIRDLAHKSGDGRNPGRPGQFLGFDLVAHGGDGFGIGADKGDTGGSQSFGKSLPFRQKAIAGMHRVGAGGPAGGDDLVHRQIGLGGRRGTDFHRFVRHPDMQGMAVDVRIDRHGGNAHPAGGLDDAASDFAAIGNQYLAKQGLYRNGAGET